MNGILNSTEIEALKQKAAIKLNCQLNEVECYESTYMCGSYGFPKKNVYSAQAFIERTILAFRKAGEKEGLVYLNEVWKVWNGDFPINNVRF